MHNAQMFVKGVRCFGLGIALNHCNVSQNASLCRSVFLFYSQNTTH